MKDNTYDNFNASITDNSLICSKDELELYLSYGYILKLGNNYITRDNKKLQVNVVEPNKFDFNLSVLISKCNELSKQFGEKRIYCMTERCYNKYKELGFIISKDNKDYYRYYTNELWLVNII